MLDPFRRPGATLLVVLALVASPLAHAVSSLGISVPVGVPDARATAGWERVDGHLDSDTQRIEYALYVDPRHSALYVVTRYRVTALSRTADGRPVSRPETEKLLWNSRPGTRELLHCYELQAPPASEPQGEGAWQRVPAGSDEYLAAMATAIRLYGHHSAQLHAAIP